MAKKQDMAALLDKFEADAAKEHDKKEAKASVSSDASEGRATSLVSMTKSDKERLTAIAKAHGLSLSAFFRLAADEYIANNAAGYLRPFFLLYRLPRALPCRRRE